MKKVAETPVVAIPVLENKELKQVNPLEETKKDSDIFITKKPSHKDNNVTIAPATPVETEYEEEEEEEESEEELKEGGAKDKKPTKPTKTNKV